jgi:hypothetical protein
LEGIVLALSIPNPAPALRDRAIYAAVMTVALAREEHRGRRPRRLLEPSRGTWARFRGRLSDTAFLELLLEDAAVAQPVPFDAAALFGPDAPLAALPDSLVRLWLDAAPGLALDASSAEYMVAQAAALGLPTRLARSELHRVKPHHRVLELPGTGGQLAHHLITTQGDLVLHENFTIVCDGWRERALAGLLAVELGASGAPPISTDPQLSRAIERCQEFHLVVGLDPDKGGAFDATWLGSKFPNATIQLV